MFVYDLHFMTLLPSYAKYLSVYRVSQSIYLQGVHWYISIHRGSNEKTSTRICIFLYRVSREMYLPTGCTKKCIVLYRVSKEMHFPTGCTKKWVFLYRVSQEMNLPTRCTRMCINQHMTMWVHCIQCLHVSVYLIYMHVNLTPYISNIILHHTSSLHPSISSKLHSFSLIPSSFIYLFIHLYKYICI